MSRILLPSSLLMFMLTACTLTTVPPTPILPPPTLVTPPLTFVPSTPIVHSTPRFQVFILTPLTTCLAGNEFASGDVCAGTKCGDCSCAWEDFDPPSPQSGIPPKRINDPQFDLYEHKICLDITLTDEEISKIKSDMQHTRDWAYEWSGGALDLQLEFTVLPAVFTGFTAPDFVIGPFEIDDELLEEYVLTSTDFVYVVTGVNDYARNQHLAYWCGSSYGELSIRGAGYAYIQYNHNVCNSVTIDGQTIYEPLIHEWIHNLDWALYNINGIPDPYQHVGPDWARWDHATWPACGKGSSDPLNWFPSIDFCEWDPDWMDCNNIASAGACLHAGEVGGKISWYEHVISSHYPRTVRFNGNYCRDGRQDFSETGVDTGWPCP